MSEGEGGREGGGEGEREEERERETEGGEVGKKGRREEVQGGRRQSENNSEFI